MNKINWKHFAATSGYKSLKAAYIHDLRKKWRNKKELIHLFRWVIDRAKHYAYHKKVPIETILNDWETKRDYWWLNYYQSNNIPKLHSNNKKLMRLKGIRKRWKKDNWLTLQERKNRVCRFIIENQKPRKKKARWSEDYKRSMSR